MITIEESIFKNAKINSEKIAIRNGKESVSYKELWERILWACRFFKAMSDYAEGKKVIIAASKQTEFLYAYFGAHLARLVVLPIDSETNPTRFDYIRSVSDPFLVIGFDKVETDARKISLKEFHVDVDVSFSEIEFPAMESVADILFTTGTTGDPKGVPLTYENEAAAAMNINSFIGNGKDDVELLALPLSHSFGLGRIRCCLSNGQTLILLGSFVNTKRIFRLMEEENVAGFTMVPSSWKFLQKMSGDQLGNYADRLRYVEMGSAYFSEHDKKELAQLLPNTRVAMHYGLTEASRSTFLEFHSDMKYLGSVGKASPNTEIKIFDENGNCLPADVEGEICIKGKHVMKGYLNVPDEDVFFDGYFRTGDWGYINSEGYVFLKSRKKELINVGGKKVSPQEVEDQLLKIPGVKDCACVAAEDPEGILGEVVKAFIVTDDDSLSFDSIRKSLSGELESYKIPVVYQLIDVIPRTHNGKIQRGALS